MKLPHLLALNLFAAFTLGALSSGCGSHTSAASPFASTSLPILDFTYTTSPQLEIRWGVDFELLANYEIQSCPSTVTDSQCSTVLLIDAISGGDPIARDAGGQQHGNYRIIVYRDVNTGLRQFVFSDLESNTWATSGKYLRIRATSDQGTSAWQTSN